MGVKFAGTLPLFKSLGWMIALGVALGGQPIMASGETSPDAAVGDQQQQIDDIVTTYHRNQRFHGSVQVKVGGELIYSGSRGVANDAFDVLHKDDSRFMIASVSKMFTAAAVMKLVEDGLVDLDGVYGDYVPWESGNPGSEKAWNSIRIRELLNHSSGSTRDIRATDEGSLSTYQSSLSVLISDQVNTYNMFPREPGSSVGHYSNFGYVLLAQLVHQVSKLEFHEFLKTYFFRPLEMKSTGQYHRMFNIRKMADGYSYPDTSGDLLKRCCADASNFVGSHGLYSDVNDLMIWLGDLSSGAPTVLSQDSVNQMWEPSVVMSDNKSHLYGLGHYVGDWKGHKTVWHDGMESGYLSYVLTIPKLDIQIVILGNRHDFETLMYDVPYPERLARDILEILKLPEELMLSGSSTF